MANIKISALPAATFANDADLIPIVQSGVTKKVTPAILLENLWAETTAINGLIDGILATPASSSLYTSSGTLFNNGIAQAKNFLFKTSTDGSFNPSGTYHEMRFNGSYNDTGGYSTDQPGAFGMKGAGVNNKLVLFNMFGGATPTIQIRSVDTVESRTRSIALTSDELYLGTETGSGYISLRFNNNGAELHDQRSTTEGLTYGGNYSADIITRDRSIPDVGTVKQLITANAASIYTASGNVFDTGTATFRRFGFITDLNAGYNTAGHFFRMNYGSLADTTSGGLTDTPGAFNFVGKTTGNAQTFVANYIPTTRSFQFSGYNGSETHSIDINPFRIVIAGGTVWGSIWTQYGGNGGIQTVDNRTPGNQKGLTYFANYNADILLNNRSIPDVEGVKTLRQQANTWTTGTRPAAPVAGMFGFNTTFPRFEGWDGSAWVALS